MRELEKLQLLTPLCKRLHPCLLDDWDKACKEAHDAGDKGPRCPHCHVLLTTLYGPHVRSPEGDVLYSFKASPDRLWSAIKKYGPGLFRFTCQVCNYLRQNGTLKASRRTVSAMLHSAMSGGCTFGDDGYLRATPSQPAPPVAPVDKWEMDDQGKGQWDSIELRCELSKQKPGRVKENELFLSRVQASLREL